MATISAQTLRFYVATNGNDNWSGRLPTPNSKRTDGPFATLHRARDAIRELKRQGKFPKNGVIVEVRAGVYELSTPIELTAEDSGLKDAPVVYRARKGETVRLLAGKRVTNWQKVTDQSVLSRLDENVRDKVWQADLKALGVADFGSPAGGGLELFFNGEPMKIARYPNDGFMRIVDVVEYDGHQIHGLKGSKVGRFYYEGDRPKRWLGEKDVWLHGYWFWDWSDQRHKLKSIDPEKRILEVEPPYHYYGYRKGQWFYAYNILAELDSPKEWYLDRQTGKIYFHPPTDIAKGEATVSVLPTLLMMRDVSYVRWEGFIMEGARGTVVTISGGSDVGIAGCVIRNSGGWAVVVEGGKNHSIVSCDIYSLGEGGISLNGGDRKTLTPSNHLAENNHIHHYARWHRMYRPAIALNGVGNKARHNLIHDAPHQALSFSGNEHLIEFNFVERVCLESNDAGAIYSGRDWTWRGTIIRFNLFRDITGFESRGCMGVYLDDMLCGTIVFGNIFERVTRAAFIGGGRDNIVENNIFVNCVPAVHVDARAMGWASYHVDTTLKERLMAVPYKQPPWIERYPQLVNILEGEPAAPKGNIIRRNICVGGRWMDIEEKARPYVLVEDNLIDAEPQVLFVNASKGDYRLKPNSPAVKIGFKPIPLGQIGLYRDRWRTKLQSKSVQP
ncbi:MAG: right-handed parallel beta-helix repeat-containing protein [Armatimonadetes bacterium]|nr:right-handed parallel beta-helix repeat-containing protein [Armatimonadota bacterium]